jgi:hypothetical protein
MAQLLKRFIGLFSRLSQHDKNVNAAYVYVFVFLVKWEELGDSLRHRPLENGAIFRARVVSTQSSSTAINDGEKESRLIFFSVVRQLALATDDY